jgi:hypothetical protein
MRRFLPACLVALVPFALLGAGEAPTPSVRELAIRAPVVIVGEPNDPVAPKGFKVREVLRGRGLKRGEMLSSVSFGGHALPSFDPPVPPRHTRKARRVARFLLFLEPTAGAASERHFRVLPGGLRALAEDGRVLAPRPAGGGGYTLEAEPGVNWSLLLAQVRSDVASVDRLLAVRGLAREERRNAALLAWVEGRPDRGAAPHGRPGQEAVGGWGELEVRALGWVLEGGRPEDCWRAVRLFAERNDGALPPLKGVGFGTPQGRAFLLRVAKDEKALLGDRVRAVRLLGLPATLRPSAGGRVARPAGAKERGEILGGLLALLEVKHDPLRAEAVRGVRRVGGPGLREALARLEKVYEEEPPGEVRDELAETLCVLGEPGRWKELTGNPPGVLACLRDPEHADGQVHFWLSLRGGGRAVYECPTLVLERLGWLSMVKERKQTALPVVNLPRPWKEGWDGKEYLLVRFPVKGMSAGTWRVKVRGTVGKDGKATWTSEPKTFTIKPPPKNPRGPYGYGGGFERSG